MFFIIHFCIRFIRTALLGKITGSWGGMIGVRKGGSFCWKGWSKIVAFLSLYQGNKKSLSNAFRSSFQLRRNS